MNDNNFKHEFRIFAAIVRKRPRLPARSRPGDRRLPPGQSERLPMRPCQRLFSMRLMRALSESYRTEYVAPGRDSSRISSCVHCQRLWTKRDVPS